MDDEKLKTFWNVMESALLCLPPWHLWAPGTVAASHILWEMGFILDSNIIRAVKNGCPNGPAEVTAPEIAQPIPIPGPANSHPKPSLI